MTRFDRLAIRRSSGRAPSGCSGAPPFSESRITSPASMAMSEPPPTATANDAAASAGASLAVAVGGGSDIAMEAGDVILLSENGGAPEHPLGALPLLLRIARRSKRVIRTNLAWAFAYNAVAIPLAATGRLSPMAAAVAMVLSSLAVVA